MGICVRAAEAKTLTLGVGVGARAAKADPKTFPAPHFQNVDTRNMSLGRDKHKAELKPVKKIYSPDPRPCPPPPRVPPPRCCRIRSLLWYIYLYCIFWVNMPLNNATIALHNHVTKRSFDNATVALHIHSTPQPCDNANSSKTRKNCHRLR